GKFHTCFPHYGLLRIAERITPISRSDAIHAGMLSSVRLSCQELCGSKFAVSRRTARVGSMARSCSSVRGWASGSAFAAATIAAFSSREGNLTAGHLDVFDIVPRSEEHTSE